MPPIRGLIKHGRHRHDPRPNHRAEDGGPGDGQSPARVEQPRREVDHHPRARAGHDPTGQEDSQRRPPFQGVDEPADHRQNQPPPRQLTARSALGERWAGEHRQGEAYEVTRLKRVDLGWHPPLAHPQLAEVHRVAAGGQQYGDQGDHRSARAQQVRQVDRPGSHGPLSLESGRRARVSRRHGRSFRWGRGD